MLATSFALAVLVGGGSDRVMTRLPGAWGWPVGVPDHWPEHRDTDRYDVWASQSHAFGVWCWEGHCNEPENFEPPVSLIGSKSHYEVAHARYGWPFYAMQTTELRQGVPGRRVWAPVHERGVQRPAWLNEWLEDYVFGWGWYAESAQLPVGLVWPGAALNALAYAVVWWGLASARRGLMRRRAYARGECAECGYELGGLTTCPECGREQQGTRG